MSNDITKAAKKEFFFGENHSKDEQEHCECNKNKNLEKKEEEEQTNGLQLLQLFLSMLRLLCIEQKETKRDIEWSA